MGYERDWQITSAHHRRPRTVAAHTAGQGSDRAHDDTRARSAVALVAAGTASARDVAAAQRVVGNRAVQRLIQQHAPIPSVQCHPEHAPEEKDIQRLAVQRHSGDVQRHPEHAPEEEDIQRRRAQDPLPAVPGQSPTAQRLTMFGKKVWESKKSMKRRMEAEYGKPFNGALPKSMLAKLDKILKTLPRSHTAGNDALKAITAGGGIGANASAYDSNTNEIEINRPTLPVPGEVKMPWWLYLLLDKGVRWQRTMMDEGAMSDFDIDGNTDAALGLAGRREVMGGVSNVLSRERLVNWTMRHEMGHSVDQQTQAMPMRGKLNSFGGWRMHDNNREAEVAKAFLTKAGFTDPQQAQATPSQSSLLKRATEKLTSARDQIIASKLEDRTPAIAAIMGRPAGEVKPKLKAFDDAAAVAASHPWTFADGGGTKVSQEGRTYHLDHYGSWVSYLSSARSSALSNYQFSSPGEWFAESYAAFYDPQRTSAARDRMPADVKKWFGANLGAPSTTRAEGRASTGGLVNAHGELGTLADLDDQVAAALNDPTRMVTVDRATLPADLQALDSDD